MSFLRRGNASRIQWSGWIGLGALALWLALSGPRAAHATHAGFAGAPPVERFSPDLDVYPQNFDVVQDLQGIVYVGNYEGLMEFDGERWRLIPLPNGDLVRTLAVDAAGTVYLGGYDIFGYLKRDAAGRNVFEDLSPKFKAMVGNREVADIYQIVIAPEGVYFRALYELFLWDPKTDTIAHWHHPGRFGAITVHHAKTMIQFRGEGFKVREGNIWRLRPDTRHLTTLISDLVPMADGGMLSIGNDGKWWRINDTTVTPARLPPGMLPSSHYTRGRMLEDKSIALISVDGDVTILDPAMKTMQNVKLESGFLSGINLAGGSSFMVSAQQTIYRVSWPAAWSVLGTEHGADGDLDKIAEWNGEHYLMASGGALKLHSSPVGVSFVRMPWGSDSAFDLIGLGGGRALLAGTHRLKVIENGIVRDHSAELTYPRQFMRSRYRPEQIFLGSDGGLRVIDTKGGVIRVSANAPKDITASVFTMVERGPNEFWVGTGRHGVWRYTLSDSGAITAAEQFGAEQGLRFGKLAEATVSAHPDGSLLASTHKGIFRFEGGRFVETDLDGLGKQRAPDDLLNLLFMPNGDQWAYGPTRIYLKTHGGTWQQQDVRNLRRGAIGIAHVDPAGQVVFVCTNALLVRPAAKIALATPAPSPPQVVLRAVTQMMPDGKNVELPLNGESPLHLKLGNFGLRFDFALPELVRPGIKRYQAHLVGVDEGQSEWGKESSYTYSDLRAKTYRLEVKSMDSQGRVSTMAPYTIIVDPPWYATGWARAAGAVVVLVLAWLALLVLAGYRTRRLEREKVQLENKVELRTRELETAIHRLDMMAHVDGLTGVPNRRRLDEYLQAVWTNCAEQKKPLSLLAIDVDNFKNFNDQRGHLAGDELLKALVQECLACLRRTEDLLARYGGEEFVVVLPGADLAVARNLAETMRLCIEGSSLGVTISVGVSVAIPNGDVLLADLFARADEALYAAKRGGRNRVCVLEKAGDKIVRREL